MPRKTIAVQVLKEHVNKVLKDSADEQAGLRTEFASLLEWVLFETGNYRGYNHLPGIVDFTSDPPEITGDQTRRSYY